MTQGLLGGEILPEIVGGMSEGTSNSVIIIEQGEKVLKYCLWQCPPHFKMADLEEEGG